MVAVRLGQRQAETRPRKTAELEPGIVLSPFQALRAWTARGCSRRWNRAIGVNITAAFAMRTHAIRAMLNERTQASYRQTPTLITRQHV
jgi:hypothetical protein